MRFYAFLLRYCRIVWSRRCAALVAALTLIAGVGTGGSAWASASARVTPTVSAQTYIFWANYGSDGSGTTIGRANLDGTHVRERFITGAEGPIGAAA
jgi:hypothetical protein